MTRTEVLLAAAALLALEACRGSTGAPPHPEALEPRFAYAAAPTAVEIFGQRFWLEPVQDVGSRESRVAGAYRAWLGATELEAVAWVDAGRLTATVPAGLAPGRYPLIVEGPFGRGTLPEALVVLAGWPPELHVALDAPAYVSVGQRFAVSARVENFGGSPLANVTPELAAGGDATWVAEEPPGVAALDPGEAVTIVWDVAALATGEVPLSVTLTGTDPRLADAAVRASATGSVRVQAAALLDAELVATPLVVNVGQEIVVRMAVRNAGEAAALEVAPGTLERAGDAGTALSSGPLPASASIPGGATVDFEWRHAAIAAGWATFLGSAAGRDGNSGAPAQAIAPAPPPVRVQRRALLAPRILAAPARVNLGQSFRVEAEVLNSGDSAAQRVAADVSFSPAFAASAGPAPATFDVGGAGTAIVSRTFTAGALGTGALGVAVAGTDATDGGAVTAVAPSRSVVVERQADLAPALTLPASLAPGAFTVTMAVENLGDAAAIDVLPGPLSVTPGSTGAVRLVSAPADRAVVRSSERAVFTWAFDAEALGTIQVRGDVAWRDDNDGAWRSAAVVSNVASVREAARVIASDPFSDGTPFAFVTGHRGQVYVGPNRTGTQLFRVQPDGSAPEKVTLSFTRDSVGNAASNTATPYRSLGYAGCQASSLASPCGPDNEDGRGLLTSVTFDGEEWLLAGSARRSGDLEYVYLSRATDAPGAPAEFWYVDLSAQLGANTRGFSAALASGGRLYLGFSDNGGNRPYGIALLAAPASPGLNAVTGTHALDLNLCDAFKATGGGYASITMVDTIAELGGRLYFFNDVGCIASTVAAPATKDHFVSCSPPLSAAYDERQSVEPTQQHDLEPRDRAWPQAAVWRGRLYVIRNTYGGPQLWLCDPAAGADPAVCETGDWTLVAGDAAHRTRFGYPSATAASLLVATDHHLYVGLDDAVSGVHVFRTSADRASQASDFTGRDDCTAGTAGCEGIGGDGFGDPAVLVRIFDAKAIRTSQGNDLYLTAGDGSAPVRVVVLTD